MWNDEIIEMASVQVRISQKQDLTESKDYNFL